MINRYSQAISADKYYLHEDELKNSPFDVYPVDLNAACVEEKQGNNLSPMDEAQEEKLEHNIRERFSLCTKDDYAGREDD